MKSALIGYLVIVVVAAVGSFGQNVIADEWVTIFNGRDIEGWEQKGGEATYKVESGCLVGTTKPRTPNTFLCPPKSYDDFELTFEVKCDEALNSGVQIRSISNADEIPSGLSKKDAAKAKEKADGKVQNNIPRTEPEPPISARAQRRKLSWAQGSILLFLFFLK